MNFAFELAGVKFRKQAFVDAALVHGDKLTLKPEPTNTYDRNAIQVLKGDLHIGYVPRTHSEMVSDHLKEGNTLEAMVRSAAQNGYLVDVTAKWKEDDIP